MKRGNKNGDARRKRLVEPMHRAGHASVQGQVENLVPEIESDDGSDGAARMHEWASPRR